MAKKKKRTSKKRANRRPVKKEKTVVGKLLGFFVWLTGVVVSLAVAFGMITGTLNLELMKIPVGVTVFFGWIVVVTTLLGVIFAIAKRFE